MRGEVEQVYVCVHGTVYAWRGGAGVCMCEWDSMRGEVEQVDVCVHGERLGRGV